MRRLLPIIVASLGSLGTSAPAVGADSDLVAAVKAGDAAAVRARLAEGTAVDSPGADGSTALHWAVRSNDAGIVEALLQAGARVDVRTRNGVTPLSLAALDGRHALIEPLLDGGADPNERSGEGQTALMLAAMNGRPEAVRLLLERGADVDAVEPFRGQTALMWAAGEGNPDAIRLLIDHGANLEARSRGGFTALLFAVREARLEAVEALIDRGADVDAVGPDGTSALNMAVVNAYYEVASVLVARGADPNLPDPRGSPLHTIAWLREPGATGNAAVGAEADAPPRPVGRVTSLELARQLLDAGADPNVRIDWQEPRFSKIAGMAKNPPGLTLGRHLLTYNGATAFYVAAKNGDAPLMRILAEGGADPTIPNRFGVTPLMVAAGLDTWEGETPGPHTGVTEAERLEAVQLAVELGNDVNARADFGNYEMEGDPEYTLLYYPHNVDQLADLGVGDPRWDDSTALHGSIISGQPSITRYLVEQGADVDAKNALGWTPLMMARGVFLANASREFPEAEAILLEALAARRAGADPEAVADAAGR
ncbi:MAG: ankyrin repeat domain-containing protein [Gammaproteobacteria bacterium]|nr:ankyrin repeat domain-containing protein [Gammaproteobacteria bacterium]